MGAHTGFTIILWVAIGLFVFNQMGKTAKEKESRRPLQRSPQRQGYLLERVRIRNV